MIDIKLTTQEAIALEHALSFLAEGLPQDPKVQQQILNGLQRNPSLRTAHEKLKAELDNLAQAQQRLLLSTCHQCHVNPIEWADEYCQECWELHCEDEWQRQTVQEIES